MYTICTLLRAQVRLAAAWRNVPPPAFTSASRSSTSFLPSASAAGLSLGGVLCLARGRGRRLCNVCFFAIRCFTTPCQNKCHDTRDDDAKSVRANQSIRFEPLLFFRACRFSPLRFLTRRSSAASSFMERRARNGRSSARFVRNVRDGQGLAAGNALDPLAGHGVGDTHPRAAMVASAGCSCPTDIIS
jgi:hypothetical protein